MFFLALLLQTCSATYVISLYGDVYNDQEFFTRTYPWLIDNIGGEVTVDYYLLGSGRYAVPQMCALNEMRMNTFLQAQFLKCEAEGNNSEVCLCASGIDPFKFRQCVLTRGSLASLAASKYSQLGIDASPVIEISYKNTIFEVEDTWYLKKICTIFGDNPPRGCIKPFACNGTDSEPQRSSVASFDCTRRRADVSVYILSDCSDITPVTTLSSTTRSSTGVYYESSIPEIYNN